MRNQFGLSYDRADDGDSWHFYGQWLFSFEWYHLVDFTYLREDKVGSQRYQGIFDLPYSKRLTAGVAPFTRDLADNMLLPSVVPMFLRCMVPFRVIMMFIFMSLTIRDKYTYFQTEHLGVIYLYHAESYYYKENI